MWKRSHSASEERDGPARRPQRLGASPLHQMPQAGRLLAAAGVCAGGLICVRVAVGLIRGAVGGNNRGLEDRLRSADGASTSDVSPESSRRDKKKRGRRRDKASKELEPLPSIVSWEDVESIAFRDERVLKIVGVPRVGALLTAAGDIRPAGATAFKFQWCRLSPETGKVELFTLESSRTPFYTVHTTDVGYKICVLVVPVLQTIDGSTALGKAAYWLTDVVVPGEVLPQPVGRPPLPGSVVRVPGFSIPRIQPPAAQGPPQAAQNGARSASAGPAAEAASAVPFGSPIQVAPQREEQHDTTLRPAAGSSPIRFRVVRNLQLPPIPESPRAPAVPAASRGTGAGPLVGGPLAGAGQQQLLGAAPALVRAH